MCQVGSLVMWLSAVFLPRVNYFDGIVYVNRSHTVLGRLMLSDRMEDVAMSLEDSPVFICAKEGNIMAMTLYSAEMALASLVYRCDKMLSISIESVIAFIYSPFFERSLVRARESEEF